MPLVLLASQSLSPQGGYYFSRLHFVVLPSNAIIYCLISSKLTDSFVACPKCPLVASLEFLRPRHAWGILGPRNCVLGCNGVVQWRGSGEELSTKLSSCLEQALEFSFVPWSHALSHAMMVICWCEFQKSWLLAGHSGCSC